MDKDKTFNFDKANLADQITVVGDLEHLYMHALKSASVAEDWVYYMTVADLAKQFRRKFMKEHFPNAKDEDWCMLKAVDTIRQRVYESCNTSHEDLVEVNNLWSLITEHIFGIDMSNCVACAEDREGKEAQEEPLE